VEVPLSEAFDRLEPPNGIDEVAWEGFKGHAIYVAEGIEKEKRVGLDYNRTFYGGFTPHPYKDTLCDYVIVAVHLLSFTLLSCL